MTSANLSDSNKLCICCHEQYSGDLVSCPKDGTTLTELQRENLVGTLFADKYEMLDVIGGGGMGVVYRAKHCLMNRIVAIKVLHRQAATNGDALKRFQVESQAASALSMPNILTVYDFGLSSEGQPYMVMDYLEGKSLDDILNAEGPLPLSRAVNIFIQICNALEHAHAKGILHRDIKPSNIVLVVGESQPDFVKIVDFGIAKLLNQSDSNSGNLTRTGEVFGSPMYMSPEQWKGQKLDARTDIYSLGAVMYRCLTGRPLFDSADVVQLMYKQVTEPPESFAAMGVLLPDQIEQIVFKSLAKNPAERFQSMNELMTALSHFKESISGGAEAVLYKVSEGSSLTPQTEQTSTIKAIEHSQFSETTSAMAPNIVQSTNNVSTDFKSSDSKSDQVKRRVGFGSLIALLIALVIGTASILVSHFSQPQPQPQPGQNTSPTSAEQQKPITVDTNAKERDSRPATSSTSSTPSTLPTQSIQPAQSTHQQPKRTVGIQKSNSPARKHTSPAKNHLHRSSGLKNAIRRFLQKL